MIDVTKWHFIWFILIIFFYIGPITLAWMRVNVLSTILNLCKFVNVDRSYIGLHYKLHVCLYLYVINVIIPQRRIKTIFLLYATLFAYRRELGKIPSQQQ
jgi:hypothetical protein